MEWEGLCGSDPEDFWEDFQKRVSMTTIHREHKVSGESIFSSRSR